MDNNDFVAALIFILISCAAIGGGVWFDYATCKAQTVSFYSSWGPIQGCMIEWEGKQIPLNNFRIQEWQWATDQEAK